jgi:membrane protein insertase Oxa1/YidC/SpoIIIJ
MKYMMYGMPVFFLFIMFGMASGLSIYMITNSLLRMAQSYYIKRKHG